VTARLASRQRTCKAVERLRGLTGVRSVESAADGRLRIEYNRDRTSEAAIREVLCDVARDDDSTCDGPGG
jgi:nucleoside diphosphate kinase